MDELPAPVKEKAPDTRGEEGGAEVVELLEGLAEAGELDAAVLGSRVLRERWVSNAMLMAGLGAALPAALSLGGGLTGGAWWAEPVVLLTWAGLAAWRAGVEVRHYLARGPEALAGRRGEALRAVLVTLVHGALMVLLVDSLGRTLDALGVPNRWIEAANFAALLAGIGAWGGLLCEILIRGRSVLGALGHGYAGAGGRVLALARAPGRGLRDEGRLFLTLALWAVAPFVVLFLLLFAFKFVLGAVPARRALVSVVMLSAAGTASSFASATVAIAGHLAGQFRRSVAGERRIEARRPCPGADPVR